jgi:hypothetical protein
MAETSKKRTVRIPLDYYKRPDGLARWRWILSGLAVLVAAAWGLGLGWDFWSPGAIRQRTRQLASHGPLTKAHATWENECDACHAPFRPIGNSNWAAPVLGDSRQSNEQCQSCHGAGIHHSRQDPLELACAGCHHDHQGRDASLVQLADVHCTQCHSQLAAHIQGGQPSGAVERITGFNSADGAHPEFRSTRGADPGRLAFDHARHLTRGMATAAFGPVQTLRMIREPDRARYEKYARGSEGVIELDCAACHQLVRDDPGSAAPVPPPRGAPAYMLPVTYANHCRGCHPLDFDPAAPGLVMEHPLPLAEVDASLWHTYTAEFLKQDPALLSQRLSPRPLPGQPQEPRLIEARAAIQRKVEAAEKLLFGAKKCGECHRYETASDPPQQVDALERWDPAAQVRVAATNVPIVWWRSAAFTHSAHRGVDCRVCHERAYPSSTHASHQSKDVLLPAMKDCLACHAARGRSSGGAAYNCTECHRYHNGDAALLGLSAAPSAPANLLKVEEFLKGKPSAAADGH